MNYSVIGILGMLAMASVIAYGCIKHRRALKACTQEVKGVYVRTAWENEDPWPLFRYTWGDKEYEEIGIKRVNPKRFIVGQEYVLHIDPAYPKNFYPEKPEKVYRPWSATAWLWLLISLGAGAVGGLWFTGRLGGVDTPGTWWACVLISSAMFASVVFFIGRIWIFKNRTTEPVKAVCVDYRVYRDETRVSRGSAFTSIRTTRLGPIFKYTYNGVEYQEADVSVLMRERQISKHFAIGETYTVYVDPLNPSEVSAKKGSW